MCLIVYSPKGELMPRDVFTSGYVNNNDGIGIMSVSGIARFVGHGSARPAWRHLKTIAERKEPYGVHFRYATHGKVTKGNCHPFRAPKSDAIVMHNGVFGQTSAIADDYNSDTALFVRLFMAGAPGPSHEHYSKYYEVLETKISYNKLLVFHWRDRAFTIVNEDSGEWLEGLWYSNTFSLPSRLRPKHKFHKDWEGYYGDYNFTNGEWHYNQATKVWYRDVVPKAEAKVEAKAEAAEADEHEAKEAEPIEPSPAPEPAPQPKREGNVIYLNGKPMQLPLPVIPTQKQPYWYPLIQRIMKSNRGE